MNKPPLLAADPGADYRAHRIAIGEAVKRVLEGGVYVLGEEVGSFEQEFAQYLGIAHAVGVGSGTEALHLALRVLEIGPGDCVITVSHTAVATVAAIGMAGATPRFVDIDPATFTMDPSHLEEVIQREIQAGSRVRAVIPVHLYGHPASMPEIMEIARHHDLAVIEDCAQAHGALADGKMAGTWGDLAAFSFYPTKNLGAIGDAGAVVTANAELADKARRLRQYGWKNRNCSENPGINTRLDEIQAAILRVKLPSLDHSNRRRRELAALYDRLLATTPLRLPRRASSVRHVFHQYVVRTQCRDSLSAFLRENGVFAAIHYPIPVHLQPAYVSASMASGALPITEQVAGEILSLPLHPGLTNQDVAHISDLLIRWYSSPNCCS
jgi:dTDP-4-amino-4,6-dideoxygalactose transaminase